ncbi:uncharacterized protein K441DRAFT_727773 [Cenococcum geophilum 1.58]|uniref:uncharacterized protein n=1 Tax=Cenococcum geophilum 1.58 TaxID=794803 RepID=UPI00358E8BA0|nr:hypothetical protein K441DRAFT_727773 [Cenococcum geophilum 1.58]
MYDLAEYPPLGASSSLFITTKSDTLRAPEKLAYTIIVYPLSFLYVSILSLSHFCCSVRKI